jgi:hypothetical protein
LKEKVRQAENGITQSLDEFERHKERMKEEIFEKKVYLDNLKRDKKYKIEQWATNLVSFFNYFLIYFFLFFSLISAHLNQMAVVNRLRYEIEKLERRFR